MAVNLKSLLKNKYFLIISISAIFIMVAIYTYKNYVLPRFDNKSVANREFVHTTDGGVAELYFFYTDWCPHCKSAKPIWNSLKKEFDNKPIKNTTINFIEIDCDKDTSTANKFNVEGYPTIKLIHNNKIYEYDAKPDLETLKTFLNTSL